MDNETSKKLNDTLGKMGAIDGGNSNSSADAGVQSSDMSFYVFIFAMIVAMAFYVSYDIDQRYGAGAAKSEVSKDEATPVHPELESVVVNVKQVETVETQAVDSVPAAETTSEVIMVETTEQESLITAPDEVVQDETLEAAPIEADEPKTDENIAVSTTTEKAPVPVAQAETLAPETTPPVAAPEASYGDQYGTTYQAYQQAQQRAYQQAQQQLQQRAYQQAQQQPQQYANPYNNPYGNSFNGQYNNNPYNNQYNNPYAAPYGYGYPYQQPQR